MSINNISTPQKSPLKESLQFGGSIHGSNLDQEATGYVIPPNHGSHVNLLNEIRSGHTRINYQARKAFLDDKFASSPIHRKEAGQKMMEDGSGFGSMLLRPKQTMPDSESKRGGATPVYSRNFFNQKSKLPRLER
jgi:hypothetical protein